MIPALVALAIVASSPADEAFFESKVRPVLAGSCVRCHGPRKASGGLRLDSREHLARGGTSGPALDPDAPGESLLLEAVGRSGDATPMPPDKPLAPEAVADLRRWINAGAPWPETAAPISGGRHWAFEPIRDVAPSTVPGAAHPIDAFLAADQRRKGLVPVAPADKRTLIRRATFDLTGLPPTPEEVEAFLADPSPRAFDAVADRLLASPEYGVKWGRMWLDVARYADTAGETADFPVPDAWRYRNYVIDAFNADKPFDQFLREQIAGDIFARDLPPDAPPTRFVELVTATGYLAISRRFGFDISKDQNLTIDDTLDTIGRGVLGLTIACARCHDHKYDPITANDYYALYGIFDSTRYPHPGCEKDKIPRDNVSLGRGPNAPAGPQAYAVAEGKPHDARVQVKGDPATLGPVVSRRFLEILGGRPIKSDSESGRRDLADWLADPKNPLTARVIVNRVWQGHFGHGLVRTPDNFGIRGEPPDHPELLDWLAARFVARGWSLKGLHRTILLSEAYRRSSTGGAEGERLDLENRTLWRFEARRLTAEEIRDAMLAVAGDLDPTPGGAHPFPEPKTWGFTQHAPFTAVYETNRRSAYLMVQRIKRHPFLALFDGPDPNSCTGRRDSTTVPTQALFFLNDPFVHARAEALARRLLALPDDNARLERACLLLYGRPPRGREPVLARSFLDSYAAGSDGKAAGDRARTAWAAWIRVMFSSNEFISIN
jgi:hypothetical protein